MKTHDFTLVLSSTGELTPELADSLYEATDGNLELNQRGGRFFVIVGTSQP